MLRQLISGGFSVRDLIMLILMIPTVLVSLTIHEVSHGFVAYKLGDPTARNLGRLSLNPLKHLDPVGALCMLFLGYGWAKPVPINARYFKNPRKGMALTALAGPVSNLLLGIVSAVIYVLLFKFTHFTSTLTESVGLFFYVFFYYNCLLALFNMLPLPPFDGSRVFYVLLPDKVYFGVMKYERYIMIAVMLLFVTGAIGIPADWLIDGILKLLCLIFGVRY